MAIETETKFSIPDLATFRILRNLTRLNGFQFQPAGKKIVSDQYIDTEDRRLFRAGLACRLRVDQTGQIIVTLKALTPALKGLHRRHELEQRVPTPEPATWPDGALKSIFDKIVQYAPCDTIFVIFQTRHHYYVLSDQTPLIEASLDEIGYQPGTVDYYELELELLETGTVKDLLAVGSAIQAGWALQQEQRSKFERAYERAYGRMPTMFNLTDHETVILTGIAQNPGQDMGCRATIILMSETGHSISTIATEVDLSKSTVRRWQQKFAERRLEIFPDRLLTEITTTSTRAVAGDTESPDERIDPPTIPKNKDIKVKTKKSGNTTTIDLPTRQEIGLSATDAFSEAGRKVLGFHFARMLKHEPGTKLGEDIEALHDMRVATRRMRAAFNLFGNSYKRKTVRPLLAGLKATGRALGPVRDLDVFMEKLQTYRQSLAAQDLEQFQVFLDIWASKREPARERMLAYLDSKQYKSFKKRFLKFVSTEFMGAKLIPAKVPPVPYQLRHTVPGLVYSAYDQVRAYENVLEHAPIETLHQLRISFKGLRYRLEFLHEVMGDGRDLVIEEVKIMQDHLGDLNDADVATAILRGYLEEWENHQQRLPLTERQPPTPIVKYLNATIDERHRLLISFPDAWERFTRPEVRENLARAISVL